MAIRNKTTPRTEAKRKKTPVTKTTVPTKTKTARNRRAVNESSLLAPQLITGARMLYLVWIPEDPSAVAALVPKELRPDARRSVFMNQYVVDSARHRALACLALSGPTRSLIWALTWMVSTHNPARRVDGGHTTSIAQLI
jgi:hypothetical protein